MPSALGLIGTNVARFYIPYYEMDRPKLDFYCNFTKKNLLTLNTESPTVQIK